MDLMDILSGFQGRARASLEDMAALLELPGKLGILRRQGLGRLPARRTGGASATTARPMSSIPIWYTCVSSSCAGGSMPPGWQAEQQRVRDALQASGAAHHLEFLRARIGRARTGPWPDSLPPRPRPGSSIRSPMTARASSTTARPRSCRARCPARPWSTCGASDSAATTRPNCARSCRLRRCACRRRARTSRCAAAARSSTSVAASQVDVKFQQLRDSLLRLGKVEPLQWLPPLTGAGVELPAPRATRRALRAQARALAGGLPRAPGQFHRRHRPLRGAGRAGQPPGRAAVGTVHDAVDPRAAAAGRAGGRARTPRRWCCACCRHRRAEDLARTARLRSSATRCGCTCRVAA